jgi:hypothetical protein
MARTFTTREGGRGETVTHNNPCVICGHPDWCARFADGGVLCERVENETGGKIHWPNGRRGDWRDAAVLSAPVRTPAPPRPTADPDTCDRAYRALLAAASLADGHRANLTDRGMSGNEIDAGMYRTLPPETDRGELVAAAASAIDVDLVGSVPGFVRRADGGVRLTGEPGLLIPVVDAGDRVIGLRVRVDGETDSGKYRWVSTSTGGAISVDGHTCHVCYPGGWFGWRGWGSRSPLVVVTEGEIKAAIASRRLAVPVVSVPGVGNTGHVCETVAEIVAVDCGETDRGQVTVAIAYDADAGSNPHVDANERRLARELQDAGYRVVRWDWSLTDAKGLDDLLVAGLLPTPALYPVNAAATVDRVAVATVDVDRLQRRIDALEIDLQRETDRADRNGETIRMVMAALGNRRLQGARVTAAAAIVALASRLDDAPETQPADGMYPVPNREIAALMGGSESTAGRHLGTIAKAPGSPLRREVRIDERVDPETGEIRPTPQTYLGLNVSSMTDFAAAAAALESPRPRHGGSVSGRRRQVPACEEHPDAGVLLEWTATCRECGVVVETGQVEVAAELHAPPPFNLESGGIVTGSYRLRTNGFHHEIWETTDEPESDGGMTAPTLPGVPLIPTGTHGHDRWSA